MVFQTSRSALAILALAGCSTCSPRRDRTDPLSDGPSDGAIYQGTQPNLSGQYDLRRLDGAWAWIEGVPRPTVLLLHDDTSVFPDRVPVPLELPGPGNVSSLVGVGDILLFVHRTLTGAELAVSNAPFTSARVVWSPGGSFGSLVRLLPVSDAMRAKRRRDDVGVTNAPADVRDRSPRFVVRDVEQGPCARME